GSATDARDALAPELSEIPLRILTKIDARAPLPGVRRFHGTDQPDVGKEGIDINSQLIIHIDERIHAARQRRGQPEPIAITETDRLGKVGREAGDRTGLAVIFGIDYRTVRFGGRLITLHR